MRTKAVMSFKVLFKKGKNCCDHIVRLKLALVLCWKKTYGPDLLYDAFIWKRQWQGKSDVDTQTESQ